MSTLGLRTTSTSTTELHRETGCCEPTLPIAACLLQPENITVAVPAHLHDFLGMANPVIAIDGQRTNTECAHGQLPPVSLRSSALRTARLTRRVFWPLLPVFRRFSNPLTFLLGWSLLCSQRVGCSTPDPLHPLPSCSVSCLLTWHLLPFLLSLQTPWVH